MYGVEYLKPLLKRRPSYLTPQTQLRNKNSTFRGLWGGRSKLNTFCGHSKPPQEKQQHFHGGKERCNDFACDVQRNKAEGRACKWVRDFTPAGKATRGCLAHLELPHPKALWGNTPGIAPAEVFYRGGGKTLAGVAQRGGGCSIPGNAQGQAAWDSLKMSLLTEEGWTPRKVFPTQTIPRFPKEGDVQEHRAGPGGECGGRKAPKEAP